MRHHNNKIQMDKVSIIIPNYNCEKYIVECVKSVLNQRYNNLEIIIVDDGSSDNSVQICKENFVQIDNITILTIPHSGVSKARNVGIENAHGKYISFVDSDDLIDPEYVYSLVNCLNQNNVDSVFMPFSYLYENEKLSKKYSRLEQKKYLFNRLEKQFIDDGTLSGILLGSACASLYKTDIIQKNNICFDERISVNEDGIFNLCYLKSAKEFYVLNEPEHYLYRQKSLIKREEKNDQEQVLYELNKTDRVLEDLNIKYNFDQFERQMNFRKVSELLWISLDYWKCEKNFYEFLIDVKKVYHKLGILDFELNKKTNRYKRILMKSVQRKNLFFFCFIIYYVYPLYRKIFT